MRPSPRLAVAGLRLIKVRVRWKDNSVRRLAQKYGYSGIATGHRMQKQEARRIYFSGEVDDILNVIEKNEW